MRRARPFCPSRKDRSKPPNNRPPRPCFRKYGPGRRRVRLRQAPDADLNTGRVEGYQMMRWMLFVIGAALSLPAHAQLTGPVKNGDMTITITGIKSPESKKVEMSDWRMAETPHVVVFSQDGEKELL